MSEASREQVLQALREVGQPRGGQDVVTAGMVAGVVVKGGNVLLTLEVPPGEAKALEPVRLACEAAVRRLAGVTSCTAVLTAERAPGGKGQAAPPPGFAAQRQSRAATPPLVPGVAAIIAVASGKGGVGKSTTAVNLALGLAAGGARVGLLDADIYGPSVPRLLGIAGRPAAAAGEKLEPIAAYGIVAMSMGLLVDEEAPMIWRGPMVQSALQQMLGDVNWGELDVLVVDMPPGTGDAQLTMAQRVPLAGAVIVSTPQDIALLDARKAINMFRKVEVPILGIVENMSYYCCPSCGHRAEIFAHGGARATAERFGVDFLAEIPLAISLRETSDEGRPIVATEPDSELAETYRELARKVRAKLGPSHDLGLRAPPSITYE